MTTIRMTETGGGEMDSEPREELSPVPRLCRGRSHAGKSVTSLLSLLLLSGCLGNDPPPVSALPTTAAACEALRPAFPITYSGKSDTPETLKQVRAANARFLASCP